MEASFHLLKRLTSLLIDITSNLSLPIKPFPIPSPPNSLSSSPPPPPPPAPYLYPFPPPIPSEMPSSPSMKFARLPSKPTMPRPYIAVVSDIIGDLSRCGERYSLGGILSLMDIAAGRCAAVYTGGRVVTGCMDDVCVFAEAKHGDLISAEADVIGIGRSSMLIQMRVWKEGGGDLVKGLATFVAMNEAGGTKEIERRDVGGKVAGNLMRQVKMWRGVFGATGEDLRKWAGGGFEGKVRKFDKWIESEETEVRVRKQFLPRHLNGGGRVFGGDVMEMMEKVVCLSAGKVIGKAGKVRVVGVRSLSFLKGIEMDKVLEIVARVVIVSSGFVGVVLRSWVDVAHDGKDMALAHTGVFHLVVEGGEVEVGVRKGEEDYYRTVCLPVHRRVKKAVGRGEDEEYPDKDYVEY